MPDVLDKVLLVTGSRDWTDKIVIKGTFGAWENQNVLVIHGDCKGADKIAGTAARELGFQVSAKPANWGAAGPIRNREMVTEAAKYWNAGVSTTVLAFHDNLAQSKGTLNCVTLAKKAGLQVISVTSDMDADEYDP